MIYFVSRKSGDGHQADLVINGFTFPLGLHLETDYDVSVSHDRLRSALIREGVSEVTHIEEQPA